MSEGKLTANAEAISQLVDSIHEERSEKQRPHLGPSQLGRTCNRYLWLSFRWAFVPSFNGRMKRLFRRGHREEETIITDLKKIGIDVRGEQTRLSFAPHVSGSIDAVAYAGVPGDMRTPYLLEFKTHSKRSFDELVRVGVKKAKPEHVVQMQCYLQGRSTSLYAKMMIVCIARLWSTTSTLPHSIWSGRYALFQLIVCPSRLAQTLRGISASSVTQRTYATQPS